MTVDFVTFTVKYGCRSYKRSNTGWSKSEVPVLHVESDYEAHDARMTVVSVDTKSSTRWSLAINMHEVDDFTVQGELPRNRSIKLGEVDKRYSAFVF